MSYTADTITKLTGLEPVRRLPGMYIGDNETHGLHHLLQEVLSNSLDEAKGGHGNDAPITITLLADGGVRVDDHGRGIPVDWKPENGMSALTLSATQLHGGGKFSDGAYSTSGGMHGVGLKAANALSHRMEIVVRRHGVFFSQSFSDGGESYGPVQIHIDEKQRIPLTATTTLTTEKGWLVSVSDQGQTYAVTADKNSGSGTSVSFWPDSQYFSIDGWDEGDSTPWDWHHIANRCRQMACLMPVKIDLKDERMGSSHPSERFEYPNGLQDYMSWLVQGKSPLHDPIHIRAQDEDGVYGLEVVLLYVVDGGDSSVIESFVNGIPTTYGGTHVSGVLAALTKAVNRVAKTKTTIKGPDLDMGLHCIVSLSVSGAGRMQFSSQKKESYTQKEAQGVCSSLVYGYLVEFFGRNKKVCNLIAEQAAAASRALEAAKKARKLVAGRSLIDADSELKMNEKLADVSGTRPKDETTLFLVEGDSAGGSAVQARSSDYHAILALRGKPLNAHGQSIAKLIGGGRYKGNREIQGIVAAIGAGIGRDFDPDKMRYGKVAILVDADVDGGHIRALLLTLFASFFRPMITSGRLYIAEAPLYLVQSKAGKRYCYSEKERKETLAKLGAGARVQRYKGLGEMSPEQLRETVLVPGQERLIRVEAPQTGEASELIDSFMGSAVEGRKDSILESWATYIPKIE